MEFELALVKIERALTTLPVSAQLELIDFINYLHFKYRAINGDVISFADLWSGTESTADIDRLRQQAALYLLQKQLLPEVSG